MRAVQMVHDVDPKREIWDRVKGKIEDIRPLATEVVCAIYVRPEKTKSGLYLAQTVGMAKEDQYQGKVGLVLKMGPLAFTEDADHKWGGVTPKVGDWVVYRVGDTFQFSIGDQMCRSADESCVKMIVPQPDIVM